MRNKQGVPSDGDWVEVWNIDADGFKGLPFVACKHHDEIANARLIAAAPDLLEALQITRGNIASLGPSGALTPYTPYQEWLAMVDAVIAKATGN